MSENGVSQILMLDVMRPDFERWLTDRDLHLFRIPEDDSDDLPTFGIGISQRTADRIFRS